MNIDDLRITELIYHGPEVPGNPGLAGAAFEFIEIRNIDETVHIYDHTHK